MSKSNTRVVLGLALALALASGAFAFTGAANAQAQSAYGYVASGENAGGSVLERAAQNGVPQAVAGQAFAFSPSANIQTGSIQIHRQTFGRAWSESISICRIRMRCASRRLRNGEL